MGFKQDIEKHGLDRIIERSGQLWPDGFGPTIAIATVAWPAFEYAVIEAQRTLPAVDGPVISFATSQPPGGNYSGLWVRSFDDYDTWTMNELGRAFIPWCNVGRALIGGGLAVTFGHGGGGFGVRTYSLGQTVTAKRVDVNWARR